MSARRHGLPPVRATRAAEQLQKAYPKVPAQPLPAGSPGHAVPGDLGFEDPGDPTVFYVIGDSGGVKAPGPQMAVAQAMIAAAERDRPAFIYHVGDWIYFNCDASEWAPQFYEPYANLQLPIVGIPGNHDGDTTDDPSRLPLDTWMANLCAAKPGIPSADPQDEYGRDTETQPYCDWTLRLATCTIVGLYSNVPSGGHLEQSQVDWLTEEVKAAPDGLPLLVALHHPPYCASADTEILTPEGWKRHDEIAPGMVVMTLNHETGEGEWQPCQAVNRFDVVDEPMIRIEGNTHSSLTTLEHRWPVLHRITRGPQGVRTWDLRERSWKTSETLVSTDHLVTGARCADVPTERTFSDDFVEAVAWFYTEGSVARRYVSAQATICQSRLANPENVTRIRRALTGLYGEPSSERMSYGRALVVVEPKWREHEESSGKTAFWLNTPASEELLAVAPDKVVSLDFIHALTLEQLDLFIEVSLAADGYGLWLAQNRWDRLAAFEMACILTGRTPHSYADRTQRALKDGSIAKSRKIVHASRKNNVHIASRGAGNRSTCPQRTTYTGTVWCPTTKNGTWLARRNGTVFYTGNSVDSHHGGSATMGDALDGAFDTAGRYPEMVLSGHVHDAQFFTRMLPGAQVRYVVMGNGGYHNLHALAPDATPGEYIDEAKTVRFDYGDDAGWGFLKLVVAGGKISGEYTGVGKDGSVTPGKYSF